MKTTIYPLLFFCVILCWSCDQPASAPTAPSSVSTPEVKPTARSVREEKTPSPTSRLLPDPDPQGQGTPLPSYSWVSDFEVMDRLAYRINPPAEYTRIHFAPDSFAEWLRHVPLKPEGSPVLLYNGDRKGNQSAQYAVVNIDTGKRDLQQCADAVMRLRAEYLYRQKAFAKIHFNYTSGDKVAFSDWSEGRKPKVSGNAVVFTPKKGAKDTSYKNFRSYLISIFNYAGTASLSKELKKVPIEEMQIGDVFIQGGFPGHAIVVMDMVENEAGEKQFALAQSYMPAQDIHILRNPLATENTPWYPLDFGATLQTPEWDFSKEDLKRF